MFDMDKKLFLLFWDNLEAGAAVEIYLNFLLNKLDLDLFAANYFTHPTPTHSI